MYFIVLISWISHILMRILTTAIKRKKEFNMKYWITSPVNYLYVLISFLMALSLILSIDVSQAKEVIIVGITFKSAYIIAIAIGYLSASIIGTILKRFNVKK